MLLEPGRQVGAYEILGPLGRGGMGEVYRARHTQLGMLAAIKVVSDRLESDPDATERLKREARLASSLNHPSIVTIHDIGEIEGRTFIVMEFVAGRPLADLMAAGPMREREAVELAAQVADGLAAAHAAGVVHRDLKPQNIMVTDGHRVKIVDFGLSKTMPPAADPDDPTRILPQGLTMPHTVLGTIGYMAPEQLKNLPTTFHTDQFALGVLLYEMLTGKRAFKHDSSYETVAAILRGEPAPITEICPALSSDLVKIIGRCLAKDPQDRYGSTKDLASDLADVRNHLASRPHPVPAPPPRPWVVRHWRPVFAAALVLALAGAYYFRGRDAAVGQVKFQQVAVLPFACADADRVFCDGIVEILTGELLDAARAEPAIRVIPQVAARSELPAEKANPEDAGRVLGATTAVTGAMRRGTSGLVISVTVHETAPSTPTTWTRMLAWWHRRSATVEIDPGNEIALPRALVSAVEKLLRPEFRSGAKSAGETGGNRLAPTPEQRRAFMAYVEGLGLQHRGKPAVDRAVEALQIAVEANPRSASAQAALCEAYRRQSLDLRGERRRASLELARDGCLRAIQIDDKLLSVYLTLAKVARDSVMGATDEALAYAQQAVQLAPLSNQAYHELGGVREAEQDSGNWDRAEAVYRAALAKLPADSLLQRDLCRLYLTEGTRVAAAFLAKAETECQAAVDLTPDSGRAQNFLGATLYAMNLWERGAKYYQRTWDLRPSDLGAAVSGGWDVTATATAAAMLGFYDYQRERWADAALHYADATDIIEKTGVHPANEVELWRSLASARWASGSERSKAGPAYAKVVALIVANRTIPDIRRAKDIVTLGQLAAAYALMDGHEQDARQALAAVEEVTVSDKNNQLMEVIAGAYERIGERARAIGWLGRAVKAGFSCDKVKRSPFLEELRKDPDYSSVGCK